MIKSILLLLHYSGPHRRGLMVVAQTMALNVGLDVLRPWRMKVLVNNMLGQQIPSGPLASGPSFIVGRPTSLLITSCLATVRIFATRAAIGMVNSAASVTLGQRMVFGLAADTFAHVQRLSLLVHSRRHVGDLVHRVTVASKTLLAKSESGGGLR